jgi:hypothetical protein
VLLGNYYHLLVETPGANLVSGMQWLQTVWFNRRHGLSGHLFGGRYKAVLIDEGEPQANSALFLGQFAAIGAGLTIRTNGLSLSNADVKGFDSIRLFQPRTRSAGLSRSEVSSILRACCIRHMQSMSPQLSLLTIEPMWRSCM